MKMQRRKFRIGDLAQKLHVDKFVIRFWEKEFDLKPQRSEGGQRFYEEKDFETFKTIKNLLYEKKFTIAGAKKQLIMHENNNKIIASQKTTIDTHPIDKKIIKQIIELKKLLLKLKKHL